MAEYGSEQFRQRLMEAFLFAKDFFQRHNLRYVACGGSVLGAIRHKGFIPWDDDIDLYMPRADYERILGMSDEMRAEGYEVISCYNTPGYYIPFAKISSLSTTVWEFRHHPFLFGVSIDLFPLDEFEEPDDVITARQYRSHFFFDKYMNALSHYTPSDFCRALSRGDVHNMGVQVLNLFRRRHPEKYLQAFIDFENSYKGQHGSKCVCVTQWEGRIFQTEWFRDVIEVPFEDTTITVPRQYDAYLRLLYGDYMTPPPEDKRLAHPHYYVSLEGRKSLEEIRQER